MNMTPELRVEYFVLYFKYAGTRKTAYTTNFTVCSINSMRLCSQLTCYLSKDLNSVGVTHSLVSAAARDRFAVSACGRVVVARPRSVVSPGYFGLSLRKLTSLEKIFPLPLN